MLQISLIAQIHTAATTCSSPKRAHRKVKGASMRFGTLNFLTPVILMGVLSIPARSGTITVDAPGAIPVGGSFDGTSPAVSIAGGDHHRDLR